MYPPPPTCGCPEGRPGLSHCFGSTEEVISQPGLPRTTDPLREQSCWPPLHGYPIVSTLSTSWQTTTLQACPTSPLPPLCFYMLPPSCSMTCQALLPSTLFQFSLVRACVTRPYGSARIRDVIYSLPHPHMPQKSHMLRRCLLHASERIQ